MLASEHNSQITPTQAFKVFPLVLSSVYDYIDQIIVYRPVLRISPLVPTAVRVPSRVF